MDLTSWIGPDVKTEEEPNISTENFQVMELVVRRPHPVLPSGISCIFLYYSFCSQKSLAYFLSLDSLELFESFYSFSYLNLFILSFLPFLSYVESTNLICLVHLKSSRAL